MMAKTEDDETKTYLRQLPDAAGKTESPANNRSRCSFVVTGFGPFAGVTDNPTSTLVSCLRNKAKQLSIRETLVFDTSADAVEKEVRGIYSRLSRRESPNNCNGTDNEDSEMLPTHNADKEVIVVLHMGVNYKGNQMQLEQCAYNDATFRVPDNNGYQPQGKCILENSAAYGHCLHTTLDLEEICNELHRQQGCSICCISNDPGRFVCNYTYCLSLEQCQSKNFALEEKGMQKKSSMPVECHALFLHVTPFAKIPQDEQLHFIISLMKVIDKSVSGQLNDDISQNDKLNLNS